MGGGGARTRISPIIPMNKLQVRFPAANGPMTSNEFTVKRAQDSMNIVITALHNPPIPVIPRALRVLLACRTSRVMIMRVRRMLKESETE